MVFALLHAALAAPPPAPPPVRTQLPTVPGELVRVQLHEATDRLVELWWGPAAAQLRLRTLGTGRLLHRRDLRRRTDDDPLLPQEVCIADDGRSVGVAYTDAYFRWTPADDTVEEVARWSEGTDRRWADALDLDPRCRRLAWAQPHDAALFHLDLRSGARAGPLITPGARALRAPTGTWSPQVHLLGARRVALSWSDQLRIVDVASGAVTEHAPRTSVRAGSPDGNTLYGIRIEAEVDRPGALGPPSLVALDATTGDERWTQALPVPDPFTAADGFPYVVAGGDHPLSLVAGALHVHDAADGRILSSIRWRDPRLASRLGAPQAGAASGRHFASSLGEPGVSLVYVRQGGAAQRLARRGRFPVTPLRPVDLHVSDDAIRVRLEGDLERRWSRRTGGVRHARSRTHAASVPARSASQRAPLARPGLRRACTVGGGQWRVGGHAGPELRARPLDQNGEVAGDDQILPGYPVLGFTCAADAPRIAMDAEILHRHVTTMEIPSGKRRRLRVRGVDLDLVDGAMSPDGRGVLATTLGLQEGETSRLYLFRDRRVVREVDDNALVGAVRDDGAVAYARWDHQVRALSPGDPAPRVLGTHDGDVRKVLFDPDGEVWSIGDDGAVVRWGDDGAALRIVSVGADDHAVLLADGAYQATPGLVDRLEIVRDDEILPARPVDPLYNRPDLVLRALARRNPQGEEDEEGEDGVDRAELATLEEAVAVRQRLDPVRLDDLGRLALTVDPAPAVVEAGAVDLRLHVTGTDGEAPPELLVRADGVEVSLTPEWAREGSGGWRGNVAVPLASGDNTLELAVRDASGGRSHPLYLHVARVGDAPGRVHLLAVGVADYADDALDLRWPAKDAAAVADILGDARFLPPGSSVQVLTDAQATADGIRTALAALASTDPDDTVIAYFAGHGVVAESGQYVFGTHDLALTDADQTGIPGEALDAALAAMPARQRVLLLDTCHAGRPELADGRGALPEGVRSTRIGPLDRLPTARDALDRIETLFAEVGRRSGTSTLGASSGYEYAYEGDAWSGGVFTRALLRGVQALAADADDDGRVTLAEVYRFLPDEVRALTGGRQVPRARALNLERDVVLRGPLPPAGGVDPDGRAWGRRPEGVVAFAWQGALHWVDLKAGGWRSAPLPHPARPHGTRVVQAGAGRAVVLLQPESREGGYSAWLVGGGLRPLLGAVLPEAVVRDGRVLLGEVDPQTAYDAVALVDVDLGAPDRARRYPLARPITYNALDGLAWRDGAPAVRYPAGWVTPDEEGVVREPRESWVGPDVLTSALGGAVEVVDADPSPRAARLVVHHLDGRTVELAPPTEALEDFEASDVRLTADGAFAVLVDREGPTGRLLAWSSATGEPVPIASADVFGDALPLHQSWVAALERAPSGGTSPLRVQLYELAPPPRAPAPRSSP